MTGVERREGGGDGKGVKEENGWYVSRHGVRWGI